jgi:hypothetical protein
MKKNIFSRVVRIVVVLLTVSIFITCILSSQLFLHQCLWWECAPDRNFSVLDLNLPENLFPPTAEIFELHPLRGDNVSIEAASITNYWDGGTAIYIVRRFSTDERAQKHYNFDTQFKFTESNDEYVELNEYDSDNASDATVQCGYVINDFRCIYVARYAEYTIFFSGSIGENEMTKENFLDVIAYIDGKLESLLKESAD